MASPKFEQIAGSPPSRVTTSSDVRRAVSAIKEPRRALVASAAKLSGNREGVEYSRRLREPWQDRALRYYDSVGELRYASQFYARQLSRVRFYPARLKSDGQTEPIEDGPPVEILNRIQDPSGGRSRLQYDYGRLMFVTGEGVLFGDRTGTPRERWRFLWKDEVEVTDQGRSARRKDANGKATSEVGTAYRMWTPHPKHSDKADSPMRAVLDIAEELMILTASVRGTAVSRLTNGILALSTELSPAPSDPGTDEDAENNPFLKALIEHIQAQIENPASAESKVPFILEGAYDYIRDGIKWIQLHDPATDYMERDLRVEAVKRLALGLDMPPEVLLGMSDANHWTARQVQHDMWRSHGVAKAEQFADDLAEAYLRPALEEEAFTDWPQIVVAFDDSQVVISPDRTEDADNALDRAAISFAGYRELKGIPEDKAPSEEEKMFQLALHTRQLGILGFDSPHPTGPPAAPNGKTNAGDGPPPPRPGRNVSRQEARTASILGAAAMSLRNCRSKAGARLRSHSHSCEECKKQTDGLPNSVVASALGMEQLQELGQHDPLALVKGGTDEFRGILEEWGIDKLQAEALCQRLEVFAATTLFEERQPELPPGFAAQVEQAHEVSDAVAS